MNYIYSEEDLKAWTHSHTGPFIVMGCGYGLNLSGMPLSSIPIINLSKMNRLLSIDLKQKKVTVEAGMTVFNLTRLLDEQSLALATLPEFLEVSVGACLATPVHGSDFEYTCIADLADELSYIEKGKTHKITNTDPLWNQFARHKEKVIYSVTFRCVPQFKLSKQIAWESDDLLEKYFTQDLNEFRSLTISWYINQKKLLLYKISEFFRSSEREIETPIRIHRLSNYFVTRLMAFLKTGGRPFCSKSHLILGPWQKLSYYEKLIFNLWKQKDIEFSIPKKNIFSFYQALKTLFEKQKKIPTKAIGFRWGGTRKIPHIPFWGAEEVVWVEIVSKNSAFIESVLEIAQKFSPSFHTGKYVAG
ncbi:MAG: FAD-binding protein [Parachlamydiales bacterium]|nr:FAD-binding protein [Parachlamydiales bacterium]